MGANVVANGSGAIDLTGLTFVASGGSAAVGLEAQLGTIFIGPPPQIFGNVYTGFTGPTSFGSSFIIFANSGSGDAVGEFRVGPFQGFLLPEGYVSGTALSDSATFNNATLARLGVTPGTYRWTWGTGLPNQNFTLIIGRAALPDGGSTVSLLGFALLGLAALGVINREAARSCGRNVAERSAIVIDRFFDTKQKALTWAAAHPRFMTVRILTPDTKQDML